ncbi:hypothetical protein WBG99_24005 [Streptomyces sp. TG1A-60]|uniref:hypothetical protein n=1 Tax=Streptomyces sp. TG1A-60 TaxID=3129111 RepID=UPI0030D48E41
MTARDDNRHDAEHGDTAQGRPERGKLAGAAYDDLVFDGPAYAGMDALMAALVDEPLPEEASGDAEFVRALDAAAADVALLRQQLGLIGEALVAEGAGSAPGRLVAAGEGDAAGAETDPGAVRGPAAAALPPVRPLPTWRTRTRRARNVAFGTLAAAVAASVVLGAGWVVVQAGGGGASTASDSGAGSDEAASREDSSAGGGSDASLSGEGYVACARLIVEGTVVEVEPVAGVRQDRITVEVDRYLKPDKGADEIAFPMDHDVDPRLKTGDRVLVGIPKGSAQPDIWTTKEADIARDRAWIEQALPGSQGLSCE